MKLAFHRHTVEELQSFSNTRTPSPPWVHSVRLIIPTSCCDEAAKHLIKAFGGEEFMKRTVGGTKWWQVRGVSGCVHPPFPSRLDSELKCDWTCKIASTQSGSRRRKTGRKRNVAKRSDGRGHGRDRARTRRMLRKKTVQKTMLGTNLRWTRCPAYYTRMEVDCVRLRFTFAS